MNKLTLVVMMGLVIFSAGMASAADCPWWNPLGFWSECGEETPAIISELIQNESFIESIRLADSSVTVGDFTKNYIAENRELIIINKGTVALDMALVTPYDNKVRSGNSTMIAEYFVKDFTDKAVIDKIDSYDKNAEFLAKEKMYEWKYLVETELQSCYTPIEIELSEEICYNYTEEEWVYFKDFKNLPHKNISIGLFTNTVVGDYVEFVPTINGFDILEWASWLVANEIAYYRFANMTDEVNGYTATDSGTSDIAGIIDRGRDFEVSEGDYISLPGNINSDIGTGGFTTSFWFKPETTYTGTTYKVLMWSGVTGTEYRIHYYNGVLYFSTLGRGVGWIGSTWTGSLTAGNWYHIVGTYDASTRIQRLYVNDDLKDSDTRALTMGTMSGVTYVGTRSTTVTNPLRADGIIDDIYITGEAINSTGVSIIYNSGDGFDYPFTEAGPTDTCTCAGIDTNWEINMSDHCIIVADCNLGTGKLSFTGTGNCTIDATVDTTDLGDPGANGILWLNDEGIVNVD